MSKRGLSKSLSPGPRPVTFLKIFKSERRVKEIVEQVLRDTTNLETAARDYMADGEPFEVFEREVLPEAAWGSWHSYFEVIRFCRLVYDCDLLIPK